MVLPYSPSSKGIYFYVPEPYLVNPRRKFWANKQFNYMPGSEFDKIMNHEEKARRSSKRIYKERVFARL